MPLMKKLKNTTGEETDNRWLQMPTSVFRHGLLFDNILYWLYDPYHDDVVEEIA